jgi:hypothetical protein
MAIAHEGEISGRACNRAKDAFFSWRRKNPQPENANDFARWSVKRDAKIVACRYDETAAKWHAHCAQIDQLTGEIAGTPTMTVEGVKIKRRIARYKNDLINLDGEDRFTITDSIKLDIRIQRKLAVVS